MTSSVIYYSTNARKNEIYLLNTTFFYTWALFIKFDRIRFLRATFLWVLSFSAGGLPYFGTSVRQQLMVTVGCDPENILQTVVSFYWYFLL